MINFLVTITCVAGINCPLERPATSPLLAKDQHECRSRVEALMAYFHYDKKNFQVKCEPTK